LALEASLTEPALCNSGAAFSFFRGGQWADSTAPENKCTGPVFQSQDPGQDHHFYGFCTSCCHFDGCFRFLVVFAISLLRRFLYPILDPLAEHLLHA